MAEPAAMIAIMLVLSILTFTSSTRVALAEGNDTTTTTTTLPADGFTIGDIGKVVGDAINGAISAMTAPINGFFAWLGGIKLW